MKRLVLMLAVLFAAFTFAACSDKDSDDENNSGGTNNGETDNGGTNNGGTNTGLYLGIIGFNDNLAEKSIGLLTNGTKYDFMNFIDGMSPKNGTVLYHAVNSGINSLEKAMLPNDLVNVSIVTFTDGLDIGSYMLNDTYNSGSEYLSAVNGKIQNTKVKGLNISAYSIGVRGSDVKDIEKFQADLKSLASSPGNAMEVTNMDEVNSKFKEIAESLYKESSTQTINLTMPAPEPGSKIRFTFDNVTDAANSNLYIEGAYSSDKSLSGIVYQGMTSSSGTKVPGSVSGINVTFSFADITGSSGNAIPTNNIKQWVHITSTSQWQINSEFDTTSNMQTEVERKSAVIMLVLDCSSSLGNDFSKMQSAAKDFINVLLDSDNGNNNNNNNDNTPNYARVRFLKTVYHENVLEMGLWDNVKEAVIASAYFGPGTGMSDYINIPSGYFTPVYYWAGTDSQENGWYLSGGETYFLAGCEYIIEHIDDGTYFYHIVHDNGVFTKSSSAKNYSNATTRIPKNNGVVSKGKDNGTATQIKRSATIPKASFPVKKVN